MQYIKQGNTSIKTIYPYKNNTYINEEGLLLEPPKEWVFLKAGDAAVTKKVTSHQIYWKVVIKKRNRLISKGIWAPKEIITTAIEETEKIRQTQSYQQKKLYSQAYREKKQTLYALEFENEIIKFLNFAPIYSETAALLAKRITEFATPIGSGTVARTIKIPINERAKKATIAWMRHHTTTYDQIHIAHIKGERQKIRKEMAYKSFSLLEIYQKGLPINKNCPLWKTLYS